jgi:hypothetical protein
MKTILLAAALCAVALPAQAETHVCRGPVTYNGPPYDYPGPLTDDGTKDSSRLIRAKHITESCLFDADTAIGKEILSICGIGDTCIVKAQVSGVMSDVYIIKHVLSVTKTRDLDRAMVHCPNDVKVNCQNVAGNPNFGKAGDYGSERFAMINRCMTQKITAKAEGRIPESVEVCMNANGFAFCPECRIFGNKGPKCLDENHMHSWCWVKDED